MTTFLDKSHAENILQQLWEHRETDQFCDVVLISGTEEKQIPAHRSILSIASEYFKGRFTYTKSKEIKMDDVDSDTLNSLIKYCYTGRVEIKEDGVQDLLQTADMLLLTNVVTACGDFLEEYLHPTNCLGFNLLAERHNCQALLNRANEYIADNFMDVYNTEEFLELSTEQLGKLLARDDLRVSNEEHIFNSLLAWLEHDRIEREEYKDELLKLVRLPLIRSSFLYYFVKPICTSTPSLELYVKATEWHSLPKSKRLKSRKFLKPRTYEHLMGITLSEESFAMFIHYYCPQRRKWIKLLNDLDYRDDFGVAIIKEELFIVGGSDAEQDILNTVICLNLKTMTLTKVRPMIKHRANCGVAVLDGLLYVAGGWNESGNLSSTERYDPKTNTWNEVASLSVGRVSFGLVALNGKLYAIGNFRSTSGECYDPHQNEWTSIASMSDPKFWHMVVVANGILYTMANGGKTSERYDTITDQWTTICSIQDRCVSPLACTTFQNKVIVCYIDRVDVYNATINKWKTDASLRGLRGMQHAFSYSGRLLKTEFADN